MAQHLVLKGINQIKTYISNTPRHSFHTSQYNFNFHDIKAKNQSKVYQWISKLKNVLKKYSKILDSPLGNLKLCGRI